MDDYVIAWRHKECKTLAEWLETRLFGYRWFCPQCGQLKPEDVERVKLAVIAVEADDGDE